MIEISPKCTGCGMCVTVCPFAAVQVIDKLALINQACTLCGACVQVCPLDAISIMRKDAETDLSSFKGVWVFAETTPTLPSPSGGGIKEGGRKIRDVTHELLSIGKKLSLELKEELCAVLLGDSVAGLCDELASYGADKIYLVENPRLDAYNTDVFSTVITALVTRHKPNIMLYPATITGRDLAPRVASSICAGLTADCTGLSIKDGLLLQTRPAFGGNIMADIRCPNTRPQMSTVRPNVMKKNPPIAGARAVVVRENMSIDKNLARVKVVERKMTHAHGGRKLNDASVIVSGGRGMKSREKFKMLEELAGLLDGVVGASRAAVDMGLKPKSHQVGQSGTTVSPKLYLACGISGAVQHIVGMRSSDVIISINKDPNAPIFNVSKYGIVGNLHEILPKLIEALRKHKRQ